MFLLQSLEIEIERGVTAVKKPTAFFEGPDQSHLPARVYRDPLSRICRNELSRPPEG